MIKVIAFDLVGVLVRENDYPLNEIERKIERLFGPNKCDLDFIQDIKQNILAASKDEIIKTTKKIIYSIYDTKVSLNDLEEFKKQNKDIKLVVATNHLSFIHEYILKTFNNVFDNVYISANMHQVKPYKSFYLNIMKDLSVEPNEVLFLDDSLKNIQGATYCGMNTIHVTKDTNILKEIENYL